MVQADERAAKLTPAPRLIAGTDIPAASAFIDILASRAAEAGLRKGDRTRRRVLWATAVELASTSFPDLGMDQIAHTAEVSRAALYQYFVSKEDAVRSVLTDFHALTRTIPVAARRGDGIFDAIRRTNRYYIDYFAKNAVFMERVRELRVIMHELIADKQRVNSEWADRVVAHVRRNTGTDLPDSRLRMQVFALECMIDDVLREIFIIGNPKPLSCVPDLDVLATELSLIWHRVLYPGG